MGERGRKTEQNLIKRGGLITIFTIVVWLLSVIKFIPVSNIIKDSGITVFSVCFDLFLVLFLLFHFSLPQFISRLIAIRISRGQYKNADRIFKVCLVVNLLIGIILAVVFAAVSEIYTVKFMKIPYAAFAMKCMSISFVIYGAIAVFKGYFQGLGTMMPSCVSALIEQLVTIPLAVIMGYGFKNYGLKVSALLYEKNHAAAYGATSFSLAISIGALVSLLFLVFLYIVYHKNFKKNLLNDMTKTQDDTIEILSQVYSKMLPVAVIYVLFFVVTIIGQKLYFANMSGGAGLDTGLTEYGVYYGMYRALIFIPFVIIAGMSQNVEPYINRLYIKEAYHQLRLELRNGLEQVIFIGGIFSLLFTVLSNFLAGIFFKESAGLTGKMLLIGGFAALLYGLAFYTIAFLKGLDKNLLIILILIACLFVQSIILFTLLEVTTLGITALVISGLIFPLLITISNLLVIRNHI